MTDQPHTAVAAWQDAVLTHADLSSGGRLAAVPAPAPALVSEHGEYAVGVFPHLRTQVMTYARYCAADVIWMDGGPRMVVGSPQFVTGFVLASLFQQRRARRRAPREAAPQWRACWLAQIVVTTRRLWCEGESSEGHRWVRFDYDAIIGLDLTGYALTLSFAKRTVAADWRVGTMVCRCYRQLPFRSGRAGGSSVAEHGVRPSEYLAVAKGRENWNRCDLISA